LSTSFHLLGGQNHSLQKGFFVVNFSKMYNHTLYLLYWLVSFCVFYLASFFFPSHFVLGNWKYTDLEAAIYSSFWLVVFVWVVWDFLLSRGIKFKDDLVTWFYFWMVNSAGIWLVAKMAKLLGLGISSWYWAVGVGFFVNFFQRLAFKLVTRRNLGS